MKRKEGSTRGQLVPVDSESVAFVSSKKVGVASLRS